MEWFYNLSTPIRVTLALILAALIGGIIWFAYTSNDVDAPADDRDDVGVIDTPSPEPTEEPSPEPEPTEEPDSEATEEESEDGSEEDTDGMEPVEPETTSLSIEQEEAALEIAYDGMIEWLAVDSRESLEDRQERIAPYISTESEMYNSTARYEDLESWEEGYVYVIAEVGMLEPIGGTEEDFRVIAGMSLQDQIIIDDESIDDEPIGNITESYEIFEVSLRLEEGGWRLFDYQEQ